MKFKKALRLQFWLILQNLFCWFLTSKIWSDSDMISSSIESSNFLFWHVKNFLSMSFENYVEKRQAKFHVFKFSVCVCKHTLNLSLWNSLCLFPTTNFQKFKLKKIFSFETRRSELLIDGLIISKILQNFDVRKWQKHIL